MTEVVVLTDIIQHKSIPMSVILGNQCIARHDLGIIAHMWLAVDLDGWNYIGIGKPYPGWKVSVIQNLLWVK